MLTSKSLNEFTAARRRAFIEEWLSSLNGRPADLLSFDETKEQLQLHDSTYKGLQDIEVDKIVGSVGRYRDFTRTFLPKNDMTEERWRRVDEVGQNEGFPPIDVYKVGDVYFVRDGNHRVSVSQAYGMKTIEAYVIEYKTSVPITKDDDPNQILLKWESANFFEQTRLDEIRPKQNIEFTEPGRYFLVQDHIAFHRYLKETDCGCELSDEEGVASWYDTVYMPVVRLIRERHVLKHFPGRTEADLYAWLLLHRAALEQECEALGYISAEDILDEVQAENASNPLTRLVSMFKTKLNLLNIPLKVEQAKFLDETQLDQTRPAHQIEFTEPGCYQLAKEHIIVHKYLRETSESMQLSYAEAAASWYDQVYLPVVRLVQERDILKQFPDNTEGDLYIWIVSHRAALEEEWHAPGQVPDALVIADLEKETLSSALTRLAHAFRQKLDLQSVLPH